MTASKAITDLLSQLGVLQFRLVVLSIKARREPAGGPLMGTNWQRSVSWREAKAMIGRHELRVHDLGHTATSVWLAFWRRSETWSSEYWGTPQLL
jgi:hypothetical protein